MNININDIKNGMTIILDGNLCQIIEFQHVKPGKGSAFVRMKTKNLRTGAVVENSYNTNIKIERARVEHNPMQFLYANGDNYVFMNTETYDQVEVPGSKLENEKRFLKEGIEIKLDYYRRYSLTSFILFFFSFSFIFSIENLMNSPIVLSSDINISMQ